MEDTIVAISSPPGKGAVALLRVSGSDAVTIAEKIFQPKQDSATLEPRTQILGDIIDLKGEKVDQVLLSVFLGPASYTGEDVVEIACHGGMLVTQTVLDAVISAGARVAEPGEFSKRGFLNGKMDLTQAEAVMDLISARTTLSLRAANRQLEGQLGQRVSKLREGLLAVLAHVEAYIDFPEEDIDPDTGDSIVKRLDELAEDVGSLIRTAEQGRILREGLAVVISGPPNAGKSSLLNVLLGFDRAIVSDVEGTTRDTIEEMISIKGIPVRLIDTAGLREVNEWIESEGVNRAERELKRADLVLTIIDASEEKNESDLIRSTFKDIPNQIQVLNKLDIGLHPTHKDSEGVQISCADGRGIEQLADAIVSTSAGSGEEFGQSLIAVNSRHRSCLQRSRRNVLRASDALKGGVAPELVSVDLREALDAVGEIVGRVDVEELLGEIFSSFCIGK